MKTILHTNKWMAAILLLIGSLAFQACDNDDDRYYYYAHSFPNALVTVKHAADQSVYLQLDDSTTLLPLNMPTSPFGKKEVRALMNCTPLNANSGIYDQAVQINWIDSILTKNTAADLGDRNDEVYGNDPVDIVNDWVTIAEDGYLTLRFRTRWGRSQPHFVNLLTGQNPSDPFEVEFRHNAYGDLYGEVADGLVAFRLDDLPDTQGQTVKLTLKWNSPDGEKKAQFNYCTRRATLPSDPDSMTEQRSLLPLE